MTRLVMYMLALFRFTALLYEEEGPGGVLLDFRDYLGVSELKEIVQASDGTIHSNYVRHADGFWAELVSCPFCLSGWLAIPLALGYVKHWRFMDALAAWGALWAGTYLIFIMLGHNPVGEGE